MIRRTKRPAPLGRFLRPQGPVVLAETLKVAGKIAVSTAVRRVKADWQEQAKAGTVAQETVETHLKVLRTLETFCRNQSLLQLRDINSEVLWAWMGSQTMKPNSAPAPSTRELRRSAALTFFRTCYRLGLWDANPADALPTVNKPDRFIAPLTDADVVALKDQADTDRFHRNAPVDAAPGWSKAASALALALLGAQSGEIGAIRCCDVDLLNQVVWAHGGGTRYDERFLLVDDDWAFDALAARMAYLFRTHGDAARTMALAYEAAAASSGTVSSLNQRRAAAAMLIDKIMRASDVKQPGRNRVASINEYVAGRVFAQTQRLEAVAARLGLRSLDVAADMVQVNWKVAFRIRSDGVHA